MQFADSACKGIKRVTDNLLQRLIRISASLLQAAERYQIAACHTFLFSRIFSILHAVFNTFWLFAKRRQTTFRTERESSNHSKQCNTNDSFYNNIKQFFTCNFICKISQRNYFSSIEKVTCLNQSPGCKLPAEFVNCMQRRSCLAIPLEELKFEKKSSWGLKICYPSAILIFYKSNPTITLSCRSNLVRQYLKETVTLSDVNVV
jgi:hypothetical protein